MIRLGRISYVNMAPLFFELDADVEEVPGVPTELNQALLDGKVDLAPISSIEYARHAAELRILPRALRLVRGSGRLDPARLEGAAPLDPLRRGHARERHVRRARPRAPARGRARAARRGGRRDAPHRRRRVEEHVRGSDAALRPRPAVAGGDRAPDGLRRLRVRRSGARGEIGRSSARFSTRTRPLARTRRDSPAKRATDTATRPGSSPATSRSSATASGPESARDSSPSSSSPATPASSSASPSCRFVVTEPVPA